MRHWRREMVKEGVSKLLMFNYLLWIGGIWRFLLMAAERALSKRSRAKQRQDKPKLWAAAHISPYAVAWHSAYYLLVRLSRTLFFNFCYGSTRTAMLKALISDQYPPRQPRSKIWFWTFYYLLEEILGTIGACKTWKWKSFYSAVELRAFHVIYFRNWLNSPNQIIARHLRLNLLLMFTPMTYFPLLHPFPTHNLPNPFVGFLLGSQTGPFLSLTGCSAPPRIQET